MVSRVMHIEPQSHVNSASPVNAFADGLSKRAVDTFYLLTDARNYLLGADRQWGERQPFFENVGMNYASWHDPLDRVVHMVNGFAIGGLNFFSGGGLYTDTEFLREFSVFVFRKHPKLASFSNSFFRTAEMYMKPPPRNMYEAGEWTFDIVFALSVSKFSVDYQEWSGPITQRTALMNDVYASYSQKLMDWALRLEDGTMESALPVLTHKALVIPEFTSKSIVAQLAEGNQAMQVLDMVSQHYPRVAQWLGDAGQATLLARNLVTSQRDVTSALKLRLSILAKYNPSAAIEAVTESMLRQYRVPEGAEGAGSLIDHTATPHFDLLRQWETHPRVRPTVSQAYGSIVLSSKSVPIATSAAEGIARLMPESEGLAIQMLNDSHSLTVYAMSRALIMGSHKLSPAVVARLQHLPLQDFLTIMGRERAPQSAVRVLQTLMRVGNPNAFPIMKTMIEIAHPVANRVVGALRQLREVLPGRAEEISAILRTLDVSVIETDIIFNVSAGEFALAADNAAVLMALAKESNAGALQTLLRLSTDSVVDVRRVASERLVDMALEKTLPQDQVLALFKVPQPRLRPMVEYWSVRDPATLPSDLQLYCDVVLRAAEFPTEALHVVQAQARVGNPGVGRAISRIFEKSGKHRQDLLRLLQQYPTARASVEWQRIATVAETMVEDLDFSLQLVRLLIEESKTTAPLLKDYNPQWFQGAANAGRIEGVAGLELLALQGNRAAHAALNELATRSTEPRAYFTPAHLARQALAKMPEADVPSTHAPRQPTVMLQVTQLDMQHGRSAAVADGALSGSRPVRSLSDLETLRQGVELGTPSALDALYKIAWEGREFSAEARELLLRLGNQPRAAHHHTIHMMTRVLASRDEAPVFTNGKVGEMGITQSLRHLETLVTVSEKYSPMAMDELLHQLKSRSDAVLPILRRLMDSQDARVIDFVSDRLVLAASQGDVPVEFIREILKNESCTSGRVALKRNLQFLLDTSPQTTPLHALRGELL